MRNSYQWLKDMFLPTKKQISQFVWINQSIQHLNLQKNEFAVYEKSYLLFRYIMNGLIVQKYIWNWIKKLNVFLLAP